MGISHKYTHKLVHFLLREQGLSSIVSLDSRLRYEEIFILSRDVSLRCLREPISEFILVLAGNSLISFFIGVKGIIDNLLYSE